MQTVVSAAFIFIGSTVWFTPGAVAGNFKFISMTEGQSPSSAWQGDELIQGGRPAKVFEYRLKQGDLTYIISQVWNDDCTNRTCPTKLLMKGSSISNRVLLNEEMQQVIPPNDVKYKNDSKLDNTFSKSPFILSSDGKTLKVGPDTFEIEGK